MGRVERWARKLRLGVRKKEPELGAKLKDHRDVVVQLLMHFKQYVLFLDEFDFAH